MLNETDREQYSSKNMPDTILINDDETNFHATAPLSSHSAISVENSNMSDDKSRQNGKYTSSISRVIDLVSHLSSIDNFSSFTGIFMAASQWLLLPLNKRGHIKIAELCHLTLSKMATHRDTQLEQAVLQHLHRLAKASLLTNGSLLVLISLQGRAYISLVTKLLLLTQDQSSLKLNADTPMHVYQSLLRDALLNCTGITTNLDTKSTTTQSEFVNKASSPNLNFWIIYKSARRAAVYGQSFCAAEVFQCLCEQLKGHDKGHHVVRASVDWLTFLIKVFRCETEFSAYISSNSEDTIQASAIQEIASSLSECIGLIPISLPVAATTFLRSFVTLRSGELNRISLLFPPFSFPLGYWYIEYTPKSTDINFFFFVYFISGISWMPFIFIQFLTCFYVDVQSLQKDCWN